MANPVDLRSDTVTRPTPEMRRSMAEAEVGDDILRDDPTVHRLEHRAAEILGTEAAIFTVSGTMSNEIAISVLTRPGDEVVVFSESHIYNLETGAMSAIAGVQPRTVRGTNGIFDRVELQKAIQTASVQVPRSTLLCLENSYHLNRGLALAPEEYADSIATARNAGMAVFMDGARIFNTATALGIGVDELVKGCDAAAFCLCKGLAAPVGSILAGTRSFVDEARRTKQRFGGGWRQAGVLAAPALLGLEKMVGRLHIDHENAEMIRQGLEKRGIGVDRGGTLTNIVHLDLSPVGLKAREFAKALADRNILVKVCDETTLRMVTHNDITSVHVNELLQAVSKIVDG